LGTIAGNPCLVELADIYARLICPSKEIPAKQGKAIFTLISSWAHAIMGTEKSSWAQYWAQFYADLCGTCKPPTEQKSISYAGLWGVLRKASD